MRDGKIQVLIIEDSRVVRELLTRVLSSDPGIAVVGAIHDGAAALAEIRRLAPDVVTMDIHMPGLDGYETTRQIMENSPLPIIIVSASFDPADVTKTFRAMEAGAVAAVEKPGGPGGAANERLARRLIDAVKAMAEVRVIKRWPQSRILGQRSRPAELRVVEPGWRRLQVLAIGASTGGPPVLRTLLSALAKPIPVPVLIVQHISAGFVSGLAEWLTEVCGMPVHVACDQQPALAGHAYVAPDGCHMGITSDLRISCTDEPPEFGLRPAVALLFRSVTAAFGAQAAGVLLTGMGRDGAEDLKALRAAGGVTFAQDRESALINGMPGAAVALGAAVHVLPPERIAEVLQALLLPSAAP